MKLVVDAETDKVLGASMCGPDAPEIMQVLNSFFLFYVCYMICRPSILRLFIVVKMNN